MAVVRRISLALRFVVRAWGKPMVDDDTLVEELLDMAAGELLPG
jgi:hypothetical protein